MKQSKQKSLFMLLLLVVIGMLTACSEDDLGGSLGDDGQQFSVSVTDGGYTTAREGIHTKAVENSYTTEFTAGDKIGVFAVKGGAILTEVNNLCLTATDNGGILEWEDASGNAPLKFTGADYYAYYPYQATLTGTTNASASNAAAFFANIIANWSPNTDQGTYAKYTAQDLMVANGTISNNELSFAMQHQMVLVVIELPGTKYEFSNTSPSVSDYITDPLNTGFNSYSPCRMKDGCYRYLLNPGMISNLTGSYTNASGAAKGWELNPLGISSGSYKLFKVDGGIATVISNYNLQLGDFMLKDGTLLSKDATLTATQKANCIGVVFWVGDDANNSGQHGKIVSLDQKTLLQWGDETIDEQDAGVTGIRNSSDGYLGTFNLISKRKDQPNFSTTYGAFHWIYQKNNYDVNGIWYMPAINELTALYNTKEIINPKISGVGGTIIYYWYYYSSTEISLQRIAVIDMDNGSTTNYIRNKNDVDNSTFIRAIAKF